jgi:hypothetical protein
MAEKQYITIDGEIIDTNRLDPEELSLFNRLKRRAKTHPDWNDFENYWTTAVGEFYNQRGVSRKESARTPIYKIAQDLGSRLAVASGFAREPDYRDELADLIRRRFKTRREFCEATGISEDMLSHVLARRKHLAVDTLIAALSRIGCTLRILPREKTAAAR